MAKKPKVCIIGAESWGSAISTAVCKNVLNGKFDKRVHIYVYDELVRSSYLSEVMNERHENIKYLPGIKLDKNLIAVNDLLEAAKEADILIFANSHSFIKPYCNILAGKVKSGAYAVSLIKGFDHIRDGKIDLYSHSISNQLNIPCYSMMSANSAMEMAQGKLCEITLGCNSEVHAHQLANLFQTENCKVFSIDDVDGVELCNTLKDLVALSAGFIDGLRLGDNARVACLHLGLKEMMRFINAFTPTTKLSTIFESCGLANSVASSYADKNVTFAKTFVTSRKTVQEIEANLLNGSKLLGPVIAGEIFAFLESKKIQHKYPLFTILHRICQNEVPPEAMVDTLRNHPDLSNCSITGLQKEEYSMPISSIDGVLDNVADIVPEHKHSVIDNVICKNSIDNPLNGFNEEQEPYNMELFEFLDKCHISSMKAVAAIDVSKPNEGNVEYSFEIGSVGDKPGIHLKLKDITKKSINEALGSATEMDTPSWVKHANQNLINAVGSSNVNSEFQFTEASNRILSNKGQPTKMSDSETNKSNEGKPSPTVGLTNLIEQNVDPNNNKFKALKIRVKAKNEDEKSNNKERNVKPTFNKDNRSSTNMHVRKAESKSVNLDDSKPHEEIPQKKISKDTKEQVLYDKDSTYGMRILDEEPNVTRLINMIRIKENTSMEEELNGHSINTNDRLKNIVNESDEVGNMMDQASRNVFPINQGGYTVDYLKVVRPIKNRDIKPLDTTNKPDMLPLPYSKTDNSYRPEIQSYTQDELRLIKAKKSNQLDQPEKERTKNLFTTVAMESPVFESSKSKIRLHDDLENIEEIKSSQIDSEIPLSNSDTNEHIRENFKKLKAEQKFLDDQAESDYLYEEAASSVGFSNESTNHMHNDDLFVDSEAKKDSKFRCSKLEDPSFWTLDQEKTHQRLEYFNEKNKKHTIPEHEEEPNTFQHFANIYDTVNKNRETIEDKSKINKDQDLLPFEQDSHQEHPQKIELENPIFEDIESNNSSNYWKDRKPKLVKHSKENQHELFTFEELKEKEASLNYDKAKGVENQGKDSDKLLNNESRYGDERIEGKSKLIKGQGSSAFIKKGQDYIEDSNLRFYHDKHDGEQGHEWDWLLDDDEIEELNKKSKQKTFLGAESTSDNQDKASVGPKYQRIYDQVKDGYQKMFKKKSTSKKQREFIEEQDMTPNKHQLTSDSHPPSTPKSKSEKQDQDSVGLKYQPIYDQEKDDIQKEFEKNSKSIKPKEFLEEQDITQDHHQLTSNSLPPSPAKSKTMPLQFVDKEISTSISTADSDLQIEEKPITTSKADQILSESYAEDTEVIPQEKFRNKRLKTQTMSDSIHSEFTPEAISQEDFDIKMAELTAEELLLEDDEEILHRKSTKIRLPTEAEYEREQFDSNHTKAIKEDHIKDDMMLDDEDGIKKQLNTLMTRGQAKERRVKYKGVNPYLKERKELPYQEIDSDVRASQRNDHTTHKKRSIVRPSFHPPINPRVRIPRPPFDVRDHEYHTVTYSPPPDLMRQATLPLRRVPVAYSKHAQQMAAKSSMVKLPRPVMRLPSSVMRSSVLAVELGLFAAFITRYKGGCK